MQNFEILLADDDADDRSLFEEALLEAAIPAKLTSVENGQQFSDFISLIIDPPPPDIIFLDINMPYKNGKTCLQEIRKNEKFNKVPIIMFSTSSHPKDIEETFSNGANRYIFKSDFFETEKNMLKKLFSSNWKETLLDASNDKFILRA